MSETVLFDVNNGVGTITLNSPKTMNAFNPSNLNPMKETIAKWSDDDTVKVIVIKGEGRAFSAGGDLGFLYEKLVNNDPTVRDAIANMSEVTVAMKKCKKPIISSVHKNVAGSAFAVALSSDFVVATEDTKFFLPFVNINFIPDGGLVYLLNKTFGYKKAMSMMINAEQIPASDLVSDGVVDQIVADEEALSEATAKLASRLAKGPTLAFAKMKEMSFEVDFKDFEDFCNKEADAQTELVFTKDFEEGVAAFKEKRRPNFIGK